MAVTVVELSMSTTTDVESGYCDMHMNAAISTSAPRYYDGRCAAVGGWQNTYHHVDAARSFAVVLGRSKQQAALLAHQHSRQAVGRFTSASAESSLCSWVIRIGDCRFVGLGKRESLGNHEANVLRARVASIKHRTKGEAATNRE